MKPWLEDVKRRITLSETLSTPDYLDVQFFRSNHGEPSVISDADATQLAGLLAQSSNIVELDLRKNQFSDIGMYAIIAALPNTNIERIVLDESNCRLELNSLTKLREIAANSKLIAANSKINDIIVSTDCASDQELATLANKLPSIAATTLILKNRDITPNGLTTLLKALPNSGVRTLDLRNIGLNESLAHALLTVLPNTMIGNVWLRAGSLSPETQQQIEAATIVNRKQKGTLAQRRPQPRITQADHIATIIENQRRAALEDGQGI